VTAPTRRGPDDQRSLGANASKWIGQDDDAAAGPHLGVKVVERSEVTQRQLCPRPASCLSVDGCGDVGEVLRGALEPRVRASRQSRLQANVAENGRHSDRENGDGDEGQRQACPQAEPAHRLASR